MKYEEKEIGKETARLEPKDVKVKDIKEVEVETQQGKRTKLVLVVEHPDLPEMEISKAKYLKEKKVVETGLWLTEDKDGNIPYLSAVAHLLRHYNLKRVKDIATTSLQTDIDEKGFIIIKAY